nr:type VI secretion system Vgr family protein [Burkholderia gladioli]
MSKPLPSRSYCRQSESDWNFVHRLMEEEGLFGFWRQSKDGKSHTLVVTDDVHSLDEISVNPVGFYRSGTGSEADAFTQWSGSRTLQSSMHTTRTFDYKAPSSNASPKGTTLPTMAGQGNLPEQTEVYEYTGAYTYGRQDRGEHLSKIRLEEWESRAKRFFAAGGVRGVDAGLRFELSGHPEHDRDPAGQREFVAIKVRRYIENNLPLSDHEASFPHSLQTALAQAKAGYTDELNRVKVMFVWDRQNPGDAGASCWVRVAQSDTGGGYGGVHIPRVGEEVLIGYVGGDCDRPIVLHRVYNGKVKPQWHSNGILSGHRSKEYSGSGYNQMVMDDATGQNRVQLMSSSANSMLHLGYLIDQSGNSRGAYLGSGFDLRTDDYGAVRASQGLYLTTYPKSASSQPLDVRETQQQLVNAESVVEALSEASVQHQAESLQDAHEAMRTLTDATQNTMAGASGSGGNTAGGGTGSANAFRQPVMVFGSPASIGLSSQQSIHVAATEHINLVSGQSTHVAAGKSLIASIGEKLSLFVQNAGMKLFAAKGKVEIQAQNDNIELTAQKTVKLLSATEKIEIAADKEVLLTSGGAYIRLSGGNIEIHAPGKIDVKGAQHIFAGPASQGYPLPAARPDQPGQLNLLHQYANGEAVKGGQFSVFDANGSLLRKGALDASGRTTVSGLPPGAAQVQFGIDPRDPSQPANYFKSVPWPLSPSAAGGDAAASQLASLLPVAAGGARGAGDASLASSVAGLASAGAGLGGAGSALSALGGAGSAVAGLTGAAGGGMGSLLGAAGKNVSQLGSLASLTSNPIAAAPGMVSKLLPSAGGASPIAGAAQQVGSLVQSARGALPAVKGLV